MRIRRSPFVLQRPDEPFDDRNTAILADGAESQPDLLASAPTLECLAPELRSLVANDVLGLDLVWWPSG